MYTKQQASELKQAFWTAFGQYMSPVLSAEGEKWLWLFLFWGFFHLFFKMDANNERAQIGIEITHPDNEMQQLYFGHFVHLKKLFQNSMGEEWTWQLHTTNEFGKTISRIFTTLGEVSIFKKDDWPKLITFYKQRMIALDEFWSSAKYGFEDL
jgi:hypothetical protein